MSSDHPLRSGPEAINDTTADMRPSKDQLIRKLHESIQEDKRLLEEKNQHIKQSIQQYSHLQVQLNSKVNELQTLNLQENPGLIRETNHKSLQEEHELTFEKLRLVIQFFVFLGLSLLWLNGLIFFEILFQYFEPWVPEIKDNSIESFPNNFLTMKGRISHERLNQLSQTFFKAFYPMASYLLVSYIFELIILHYLSKN